MTRDKDNFISFTATATKHLPFILIDVQVKIIGDTSSESVKAVIDTARQYTVISDTLFIRLIKASGGSVQISKHNQLLIDLILPANIHIQRIPAKVSHFNQDNRADVAIGMDILNRGKSTISGIDDKTVFTFGIAIPKTLGPELVKKTKKIVIPAGRNRMCPCGSGKQHKNCCAKLL